MIKIIFNIQAVSYGRIQKDQLVLEVDADIEDMGDADAYVESKIKDIMDEQDYSTVLDWKVVRFSEDAKTNKQLRKEEKKKAELEKEERMKASKEYDEMKTEKTKEELPKKQAEHVVPDLYTPEYYAFLRHAWIVGCVTPNDEILSVIAWFSDAQMHGDYFPNLLSARRWRWRWDDDFDGSVYGNTLSKEDWYRVREYVTRKYDVRFMDNGTTDRGYLWKKAGGVEYEPKEK